MPCSCQVKRGSPFRSVDRHFHGDHYGGVPFLLLDAAIRGRTRKMQIISPPVGRGRIAALLDLLYPGTSVLGKLDLDFLEYNSDEVLKTQHFSLRAVEVIHSEEALPHGLRVEISGKVIAYSGDTSWTDALLPLSEHADVFICECNFFSTQVKGHINYIELEKRIPEFSCKRMLLTHFDEEMLENTGRLKLEYLTDGMNLEV